MDGRDEVPGESAEGGPDRLRPWTDTGAASPSEEEGTPRSSSTSCDGTARTSPSSSPTQPSSFPRRTPSSTGSSLTTFGSSRASTGRRRISGCTPEPTTSLPRALRLRSPEHRMRALYPTLSGGGTGRPRAGQGAGPGPTPAAGLLLIRSARQDPGVRSQEPSFVGLPVVSPSERFPSVST